MCISHGISCVDSMWCVIVMADKTKEVLGEPCEVYGDGDLCSDEAACIITDFYYC